jgi:hypothetical protein
MNSGKEKFLQPFTEDKLLAQAICQCSNLEWDEKDPLVRVWDIFDGKGKKYKEIIFANERDLNTFFIENFNYLSSTTIDGQKQNSLLMELGTVKTFLAEKNIQYVYTYTSDIPLSIEQASPNLAQPQKNQKDEKPNEQLIKELQDKVNIELARFKSSPLTDIKTAVWNDFFQFANRKLDQEPFLSRTTLVTAWVEDYKNRNLGQNPFTILNQHRSTGLHHFFTQASTPKSIQYFERFIYKSGKAKDRAALKKLMQEKPQQAEEKKSGFFSWLRWGK